MTLSDSRNVEKPQPRRKRVLAKVESSADSSIIPKVGLRNLGATCYMNSILQALFMIKKFSGEIIAWKAKHVPHPFKANALDEMKKLFNVLHRLKKAAFDPSSFYQVAVP